MKILYLIILFFSIVLFISSIIFSYFFLIPIDTFELYSSVNISDSLSIGFDLNSSALTFGLLNQYSSSLRKITLTNNYNFPLIAKISSSGSISKILDYPAKTYILPENNVSIPITVYSEENSAGFYDGLVKVRLFRTIDKLFND